jgi:hypothetical protein
MIIEDIIKDKINKYYQKEIDRLKPEIKKLTQITFEQGKLELKDYAVMLGEFITYYHQRIEADAKLDEILNKLREVNKK